MNDYLDLNDSLKMPYYRVPKALFTQKYSRLSADAKLLYGLLLDRMSLSLKHNWIDKQGRVYQYFTVNEAAELLNFGHEKVCKLFKELVENDLIERKRRGMGKPSVIYLKRM